jgi:hypothetical protein
MKEGDWVVVFRSKLVRAEGRYIEADARTARIARRTPTQILVDCSIHPFRLKAGVWEQKRYLHDDVTCLRPATAAEIQQAEEIERQVEEATRKRKQACDEKRLMIAKVNWATIDDITVEAIYTMAVDPRNRR